MIVARIREEIRATRREWPSFKRYVGAMLVLFKIYLKLIWWKNYTLARRRRLGVPDGPTTELFLRLEQSLSDLFDAI